MTRFEPKKLTTNILTVEIASLQKHLKVNVAFAIVEGKLKKTGNWPFAIIVRILLQSRGHVVAVEIRIHRSTFPDSRSWLRVGAATPLDDSSEEKAPQQ